MKYRFRQNIFGKQILQVLKPVYDTDPYALGGPNSQESNQWVDATRGDADGLTVELANQ